MRLHFFYSTRTDSGTDNNFPVIQRYPDFVVLVLGSGNAESCCGVAEGLGACECASGTCVLRISCLYYQWYCTGFFPPWGFPPPLFKPAAEGGRSAQNRPWGFFPPLFKMPDRTRGGKNLCNTTDGIFWKNKHKTMINIFCLRILCFHFLFLFTRRK